jgi:P27 family predicted phage terminase small subunit
VLKVLRGNPGKRALPRDEPDPDALVDVDPPAWLSEVAQEEWRRLAPELIRLGLLTVADFGLFATYCSAWADFVTAEQALRGGGLVGQGKEKQPVRSPWLMVKYRAMDALVRIGDRFGFSPSARTSLGSPAPELPEFDGPGRPRRAGGLADYIAANPDRLHDD